jgi:hypothetical protein
VKSGFLFYRLASPQPEADAPRRPRSIHKKILGRVLNRIKAQKHLSMPCAAAHGKQQMELRALRRLQHRQPVAGGRRRVCRVPDAAPSAVGGAGANRGNQVTGIPP